MRPEKLGLFSESSCGICYYALFRHDSTSTIGCGERTNEWRTGYEWSLDRCLHHSRGPYCDRTPVRNLLLWGWRSHRRQVPVHQVIHFLISLALAKNLERAWNIPLVSSLYIVSSPAYCGFSSVSAELYHRSYCLDIPTSEKDPAHILPADTPVDRQFVTGPERECLLPISENYFSGSDSRMLPALSREKHRWFWKDSNQDWAWKPLSWES